MMLARLLALLLLLPAGVLAAPCTVPPELLDATTLPRTRAGVEARELRVLVGGSASAEPGTLATTPYHARLAQALAAVLPEVSVRVEARGRRGATAPEILALIERELPAFRPHLVIWQTGTVEAARSLELSEFTDTLGEGIARLRAAGTDVMLMETQFSRFMRANADIERYRDAMRILAAAEGAALLRRWEWMRLWADEGLDLERAPREERMAVLAQLQECTARAIAQQIRLGARR